MIRPTDHLISRLVGIDLLDATSKLKQLPKRISGNRHAQPRTSNQSPARRAPDRKQQSNLLPTNLKKSKYVNLIQMGSDRAALDFQGDTDGTSVGLAHRNSLLVDFGHQVHAGADSEVVRPRREDTKRLHLPAGGERPDALL